MPVAYEDLEGKDGSFENVPGTEQIIYFAPIRDILTAPEPPEFAGITVLEEASVIDGTETPIAMKTGKKFSKMKILMNTGKVTGEMTGDRGSRAVKTMFEAVYIGSTAELYGLQRFAKEDEYVILAPHANGDVQQIGRIKKPALMTISTDTGTDEEGTKGGTITVEATDVSGWLYDGDIPLTAAT